jgi:hypothetical protein
VNNQVVVLTIAMAFVTCYFFQVMTDEQMETLRRQISVYSTICQQLVEMHKACLAQQPPLPGDYDSHLQTFCFGLKFTNVSPSGQKPFWASSNTLW